MRKQIIAVQWIIVVSVWLYILYRAVFVSITEDEAYSYFLIKTNYWKAMPATLNTHWLNTLAIRIFLWLPGADRVWKIRLFSLLSWWLYSFSAIRLSLGFKNQMVGFVFFLAAVLNPFLIFYFSLGRGYAAACAFLLFSFWRLSKVLECKDITAQSWVKVFLPASAAVFANFSVFYFYIGCIAVYFFYLLLKRKLYLLVAPRGKACSLLIVFTSLFAISSLLFIKFHTREFDGSETSDLIDSLFGSQLRYGSHLGLEPYLFPISLGIFLVALLLTIVSVHQYWNSGNLTLGIFSLWVSAVIILCNILFYLLFKTPFLYGRTGLMFYVAILPGLFAGLDSWMLKSSFLKKTLTPIIMIVALVYSINFLKAFNPGYFSEWTVQNDTQKGLAYLQKLGARRIGLSSFQHSVYNEYYTLAFPGKYEFDSVVIVDIDLPDSNFARCDYLMVNTPELVNRELLNSWKLIDVFKPSGIMILSKK